MTAEGNQACGSYCMCWARPLHPVGIKDPYIRYTRNISSWHLSVSVHLTWYLIITAWATLLLYKGELTCTRRPPTMLAQERHSDPSETRRSQNPRHCFPVLMRVVRSRKESRTGAVENGGTCEGDDRDMDGNRSSPPFFHPYNPGNKSNCSYTNMHPPSLLA